MSRRTKPAIAISLRSTRCLSCHQPTPMIEVTRYSGMCRRCVTESASTSWRVIYDRKKGIGAIPERLRAAYGQ